MRRRGPTKGRGQGHPRITRDPLGPAKSHPRAPRAAQEPPRGPQKVPGAAKRAPEGLQEAPGELSEAQKTSKNVILSTKSSFSAESDFGAAQGAPRAAQEAPKGPQGPPRSRQERPRAAQERPKSGPGGRPGPKAPKRLPRGPHSTPEGTAAKQRCYPRRFHKLTKGLFGPTKAAATSPVANLLLVNFMHASTLVCISYLLRIPPRVPHKCPSQGPS